MNLILSRIITTLAAPALLTLPLAAAAQTEPPFHEFDAEATAAFEEVVRAHREMPALTVKSTVVIELFEDDIIANSSEVHAEFLLTSDGRGIVKLRGFTVHVGGGAIWATHEGNDKAYFTMRDDGSPYYALMAIFLDLPFPHLAIFFGEEDVEELCMQFHSRAPWIRPTAVREKALKLGGDGERERRVQIIELTSDFETLELTVDPETKLIEKLDLSITGGGLVRDGATLVFRQSFENEIHRQPPEEETITFDPGDREPVVELVALLPRRPVVAARRGIGGGGLVGREAPRFTLASLDANAIDLEELQGQVVVLDFWATWCPPCVKGLPLLHEVQQWAREKSLPVRVITVNSMEIMDPEENTPDNRREQAANFWQRHRFTLPVAMDYTDETAAAYGVQSIPTTFIIRSDGVVHSMHVGVPPGYVEQLKADILEAIAALEF